MTYRQFRFVWLLGSPRRIGTSAFDPGRSRSSGESNQILTTLPRSGWGEEPDSSAVWVAQAGDMQAEMTAIDGC